jgi:D-sedoheptulose 7-phosphate isomerase
MNSEHLYSFFNKQAVECINNINLFKINQAIDLLLKVRKLNGTIFFAGVGGSAANCSHAANDFRKIANINSICLTDNVAELTARTNDQGWDNVFQEMLKIYPITKNDILFVMSVGGGSIKRKISVSLIKAIKIARQKKMKIISIVGKSDGYAAKNSDIPIILKITNNKFVTPISESIQSLVWHSIVSDPRIQLKQTTW